MSDVVAAASRLAVHFPSRGRNNAVRAVDGISFEVHRGESLGLVGESGAGKSTVGRALVGLLKPTGGRVEIESVDISGRRGTRELARQAQMVFQDPFTSLDPRMRIESIVTEGPAIHSGLRRADRRELAVRMLAQVGLSEDFVSRYPHELSGGQRQRIGIARAMALEPTLLVCDEPVSSLDVSVQAQVLNVLSELQRDSGVSYVFIAHDLAVVASVCERIVVMYCGQIAEVGPTDLVLNEPRHPYTKALMSAVPIPDPEIERKRERIVLRGDPASPSDPPEGCRFHPRCWLYESLGRPNECTTKDPHETAHGRGSHTAACHFTDRMEQVGGARAELSQSEFGAADANTDKKGEQ